MHVLLFVFKTEGDVWGNLVNYNGNNTNRSKLFIYIQYLFAHKVQSYIYSKQDR